MSRKPKGTLGQVGAPSRKKSAEASAQLAKNAAAGAGVPRVSVEARADLAEGKRKVVGAITRCGLPAIIDIIERGPFSLVEVEDRDGEKRVIELNEERSKLWQYAMNYAADRCGLPRIHEMDLVATEGIAPLEVRLVGFPRPSDT
jgi:hypothetical protein